MSEIKADICVVGAGAGGLSVASVAAQLGARVVLVEKSAMGGDCLHAGCVPSKAMLAAAAEAAHMRRASRFGVLPQSWRVDWTRVRGHVRQVIERIAPHDSQERFESLGVRVIRAHGRFEDGRTLRAGTARVRARFFVLATGSSPFVPNIEGLSQIDFLTNENIFTCTDTIEHLLVVGGGPIGLEMAQAHRRLGAEVTVVEGARALARDDREMAAVVLARMRREGVRIYEHAEVRRVARQGKDVVARVCHEGREITLTGSHLLVATGRKPNVRGLSLENAGIEYGRQGIVVDRRLRTSNHRVFALGDVVGPYPFTHMASYQAGVVLRNMLFRIPAKVDYSAVPWVTYTDPELAQVGLTEDEAKARGLRVRVLRWDMRENDRAQTELREEGGVKVVVGRRGRILGATIAAACAGEWIQPWVLALSQRLRIGAMADMIAPYPTLAEANKRVAGQYFADTLFSPWSQRLVRWLLKL